MIMCQEEGKEGCVWGVLVIPRFSISYYIMKSFGNPTEKSGNMNLKTG